jgi:hypothetical protein
LDDYDFMWNFLVQLNSEYSGTGFNCYNIGTRDKTLWHKLVQNWRVLSCILSNKSVHQCLFLSPLYLEIGLSLDDLYKLKVWRWNVY